MSNFTTKDILQKIDHNLQSSDDKNEGGDGDKGESEKRSRKRLEKMRAIFGVNEQQMKDAVQSAILECDGRENEDTDSDLQASNHQNSLISNKINLCVYAGLFVALIYVVNKDYDNLATKWFITQFPKEARILGIAMTP